MELSKDDKQSDEEYVISTAKSFCTFLRGLKDSDDPWISTCGVFLEMAGDFLNFVEAYRVGDSISIEYGYGKHSPVWQALGQKKYVEIFYGQQETLYRDNPYSRLMEVRINRCV